MITKIKQVTKIIERNNLRTDVSRCINLQLDGGINIDTASIVKNAGATMLVLGTAFYNSIDSKIIQKIRNGECKLI